MFHEFVPFVTSFLHQHESDHYDYNLHHENYSGNDCTEVHSSHNDKQKNNAEDVETPT